jgi:hypothetical protein
VKRDITVSERQASSARPRARDVILWGGIAIAILDGLDAVVFWGLRGIAPIRIARAIASAVIGRSAFQGGWPVTLLGIALHVLVAMTAAAVFYVACRQLPALYRYPFASGPLFGLGVYFVMNYVVIPLSAMASPKGPVSLPTLLNGLIGHALLVGLPIALIARRSARSA